MKVVKVLLVGLLLLPLGLMAQDSPHSILPDTSKLTLSKVCNDVKSGIQGLGSALKVGSEHVYGVLVKQQVVNSIVWLCIFLVNFTAIWLLLCYWKWVKKHYNNSVDDELGWYVAGTFLTIGCIIFTVISISHIDTVITGFVNPEYGAIKDIMDFVHPVNPQ